jgi:TMEM175 potassium channel family protein
MTTSRLEAFSDGVIAIIVTIMVLELRAPAQPTLPALLKVAPVFLSYALSFLVVAIMWVNHHHMIHAVREVSARLLWSNIDLLFWMSLIPFVTDFLGKNPRAPLAVALYGLDLALCACAFYLLRTELVRQHHHDAALTEYHQAMQRKNAFSGFLYLLAAPLAYASIYASFFIYVLIPAMYFLPEKMLAAEHEENRSF